jgi:hypothetical protein
MKPYIRVKLKVLKNEALYQGEIKSFKKMKRGQINVAWTGETRPQAIK